MSVPAIFAIGAVLLLILGYPAWALVALVAAIIAAVV